MGIYVKFLKFLFDPSQKLTSLEGKLTSSAGCPLGDALNSLTVGPRGPMLVQDVAFHDIMAHFDRERIPERVVHAKGGGETLKVSHETKVFFVSFFF